MQNTDTKTKNHTPFLARLEDVYAEMDEKYREVADHYGFHCAGCHDNCCMSLFFHHTFLEYFHLSVGLSELPETDKSAIRKRAAEVCEKYDTAERKGEKVREMCPLNVNGRCGLYDYRPMICRLHGIPHELRMPGGKTTHGPGCDAFTAETAGKNSHRLDRTPFYVTMSALEAEFKKHIGVSERLKMTVARMIVTEASDHEFP